MANKRMEHMDHYETNIGMTQSFGIKLVFRHLKFLMIKFYFVIRNFIIIGDANPSILKT